MFLNLFNKIIHFVQNCFIILFTAKDPRQEHIILTSTSKWAELSKPILHSNNTLSVFDYNNKIVREALYYIKNKKDDKVLNLLCQILSDHLLEELSDQEMFNNFVSPIIVSVPSSKKHIIRRGYNPSTFIAKKVSLLTNIHIVENVLMKSKSTPEQKTLRRYERLRNVKNSMVVKNTHMHYIKCKCVIVIDDVMTTGATLKEAKRALLKGGARKVMSVVLAH